MMKVCKWQPFSAKTVTIIYINTTFRDTVFTAYQTSANKTSHCHCFWNLSHNHNMLHNIVSFQQWCSRDRNPETETWLKFRDRDFVIKAKTETWKFETETRDLTFLWW